MTNDGRLRRECGAEKVPVLWGLETVALLVEDGVLTPEAAAGIGRAIQRANLRFITDKVIDGFLERMGLANKRKPHRKPLALSRNGPGLLSRNDPSSEARSAADVKVATAT